MMLLETKQKLEVANEEMRSQIEMLMVERGEKGVSEMATSWIEEMQTENKLLKREVQEKDRQLE